MNPAIETKSQTQTSLFDPKTGEITPKFKKQLEVVGIATRQFFDSYDPLHVINVNQVLHDQGCFQKDCDLYKNGGTSNFTLTYEQAKAFLDDDYSDRVTVMPREKFIASAIFPCGIAPTMHKRFNSLKESLENGYKYEKIYFIVKDSEEMEEVHLMTKEYSSLLSEFEIAYINVNSELDIVEKGLNILGANLSLDKGYAIICDPIFATKVELIATSALPEKKCLGVVSFPIKDWKKEMNLYGYNDALGTHEKATVAWAQSAWNFKAREVFTEMRAYKTTHHL